jgi:hypothetical protein
VIRAEKKQRSESTSYDQVQIELYGIRSCVRLLPPGNRAILEHLLDFLHKVAQNESKTCMNFANIATCLGPVLVRREVAHTDMFTFLDESKKAHRLVEVFLEYQDFLFERVKSILFNRYYKDIFQNSRESDWLICLLVFLCVLSTETHQCCTSGSSSITRRSRKSNPSMFRQISQLTHQQRKSQTLFR